MDGFEGLTFISKGSYSGCDECVEDELFPSWKTLCQGCGDISAGRRYVAHGINIHKDIVHLNICENCLMKIG